MTLTDHEGLTLADLVIVPTSSVGDERLSLPVDVPLADRFTPPA